MNERGAALLLGLILLSAVSLIAVVAASGSILQRQMASNFADSARALESADRAEAFASAWLYSRPAIEREAGCISECILPAAVVPPGPHPAGRGGHLQGKAGLQLAAVRQGHDEFPSRVE